MHKLKAEAVARSQCDKGVAAYLAQQHRKHTQKSVAFGLLGGLAGSTILMFWGNVPKGVMAWIPLGIGLVGGWTTGLVTQDQDDAQHEQTFIDVCDQYTEEDDLAEDDVEEDEEDGAEGSL